MITHGWLIAGVAALGVAAGLGFVERWLVRRNRRRQAVE